MRWWRSTCSDSLTGRRHAPFASVKPRSQRACTGRGFDWPASSMTGRRRAPQGSSQTEREMIISLRHRQSSERDLAALADGSLPVRRRARVEQAVGSSPQLQADLRAERRALAAIRGAAGERAPVALRARLELARDPDPRWRLSRLMTATAATAAVAVAAFAAALAVTI